MKITLKKIGVASIAAFVIAISFFAGLYVDAKRDDIALGISSLYKGTASPAGSNVNMEDFWKVWNILETKYVKTATSTANITEKEKVFGAIKGLTDSLGDPYTSFFTPEEAKSFKADLSGTLEGIGAILNVKENELIVVSLIKNSPAEKIGLLPNDKIVLIDGVSTNGMSTDKAVTLIRGKKGTKVTLSIERKDVFASKNFIITRDKITTPVVETSIHPKGVFVIKLSSFTSNSPELFRDALKEFVNSGTNRLVIDMRNNTGGYLNAAVDMASWFLPEDKVIVTEKFGNKSEPVSYYSKGYNLFSSKMKVILLVNENSASASEILAGALRDYKKATLVGKKTFGKGSVQELISVTNDAMLKITIAEWYTPNGTSISHNGLVPDVEVEYTEEDFKNKKDPQLDKAIELALKIKS